MYIYIILCTVPISTPYHFSALSVWAPATSTVDLLRVFPDKSEVQATYSQPPAPQLTCSRHPELTKHLGQTQHRPLKQGGCYFFFRVICKGFSKSVEFSPQDPSFRSSLDNIVYPQDPKEKAIPTPIEEESAAVSSAPLLMGLAGQATETCEGKLQVSWMESRLKNKKVNTMSWNPGS